jgi:hypothetical protein
VAEKLFTRQDRKLSRFDSNRRVRMLTLTMEAGVNYDNKIRLRHYLNTKWKSKSHGCQATAKPTQV